MNNSIAAVVRQELFKAKIAKEQEALRLRILQESYTEQYVPTLLPKVSGAIILAMPDTVLWRYEVICNSYHYSFSGERDHVYLYIYFHLEQITSWSMLTPMFAALDVVGIPVDSWKSQDNAESYTRIFTHSLEDNEVEHRRAYLHIHATLPGDTDECRRVIVGYERDWIPHPGRTKYELRCKDEGAASA